MVTRPEPQAQQLCQMISAAGGRPILVPVMSIEPPGDSVAARRILSERARFNAVIFVSRNAVEFSERLFPGFLSGLAGTQVFALGAGTVFELRRRGVEAVAPGRDGHGSEALLDVAGLQPDRLRDRCILIVRGIGGRAHLGRELDRRGARVSYAEVYRRAQPRPDPESVRRIWRDERPDVIVTTSVQGVEQLVSMTDPESRGTLLATALVTISERVARRAAVLGFHSSIHIAPAASDAGLMHAIRQTFEGAE